MRKTFFLMLLAMSFQLLSAQSEKLLPAERGREVMQSLTRAAAEIRTLQCQFVQTKTSALLAGEAVSKGNMVFRSPDRLLWRYTEPFAYTLLVRGDSVTMQAAGQQKAETAVNSRLQRAVSGMVTGMVSGRKLFDENMYEIQLFDDGKSWRAEMQPKSRSMKRMFTQLTLQFDKQSQRVTEVKFVEAGGDRTTIRFKEVSCNVPIDNSLFVNR